MRKSFLLLLLCIVACVPACNNQRPIEERDEVLMESPDDVFVRAQLDAGVAAFSAVNEPVQKVIERFAKQSELHVFVNWQELAKDGIQPDRPISFSVKQSTNGEILKTILGKATIDKESPEISIRGGMLEVSTRQEQESVRNHTLCVFDVRAVLPGPQLRSNGKVKTIDDVNRDLLFLIERCVDEESWRNYGGTGTARIVDGQLIVSQTVKTQRAIAAFLRDLRGEGMTREFSPDDWFVQQQLQKKYRPPEQPMALADILTDIRSKLGAKVEVDWLALDYVEASQKRVTLNLPEMTLEQTLHEVLAAVPLQYDSFDYAIIDGVLRISTKAELVSSRNRRVGVFDVRDLIPAGLSDAPLETLSSDFQTTERQEFLRALMHTLEEHVDPDSWQNKGGVIGWLREYNGRLIVNQTTTNQRTIFRFLQKLRASPELKRQIQRRFEAAMST